MKLLAAALLWLGALTVACGQGTIRYVPIPGYQMPGQELGSVPNETFTRLDTSFDFDGNGITDLVVRTIPPHQQYVLPADGGAVIAARSGPIDLSTVVVPLPAGFEIGPTLGGVLEWVPTRPPQVPSLGPVGPYLTSCFDIGCLGLFYRQTAYMGFQFQIDDQTHYGWMHLREERATAYVFGYAYNTVPGQPILAGQVPEPSTWALLIVGGLGFLALRRRRTRSD